MTQVRFVPFFYIR